jgi:hypothetical protein
MKLATILESKNFSWAFTKQKRQATSELDWRKSLHKTPSKRWGTKWWRGAISRPKSLRMEGVDREKRRPKKEGEASPTNYP